MADLALYGTIAGRPRFVPNGALIGSELVRRPTASGYPGLERLKNSDRALHPMGGAT
jgi:hypothetical protein